MATYRIEFIARYAGALGRRENFTEYVEAPTYNEAVIKLYDKYEHIHVRQFEEQA